MAYEEEKMVSGNDPASLVYGVEVAGIHILYIFIALWLCVIIWLAVLHWQNKKMKKRLEALVRGAAGESLEDKIERILKENVYIASRQSAQEAEIRQLMDYSRRSFQKYAMVRYDAFEQMGGKLSFCLCMLDQEKNGFILNSVHNREGCYVYIKQIERGICPTGLGREEGQSLEMAMGELVE